MSDFEQVPFGDVEFAENPEPRCPFVLMLDTSYSMAGEKMAELNKALRVFEEEIRGDKMAAKRAEVAIVTFGPVRTLQEFVTADSFRAPELSASGDTPMGAAIEHAVRLIDERKRVYKNNGIMYYRPWLFLITDGAPTDDVGAAASRIREAEASKSLTFYGIAVADGDMERLAGIFVRQPLKIDGLKFREFFVWLSNTMGTVARSQPGDAIRLKNPIAPDGWAVVD